MWAYRLQPADDFGLLSGGEAVAAKMTKNPGLPPGEFDRDVKLAKAMATSLGWDGTMGEAIRCFAVPGPHSFMVGYVLVQATSSQRFVISPAPLTYMLEHIDWDAHTSIEEVQRATAALRDDRIATRPPIQATEWSRSRNGNYYSTINGALVTIIPARVGEGAGFKAFVSSADKRFKAFSQRFKTELECAQYVNEHFYDIIRAWGATAHDQRDNPFAGVDFSAGEDFDDDIPF